MKKTIYMFCFLVFSLLFASCAAPLSEADKAKATKVEREIKTVQSKINHKEIPGYRQFEETPSRFRFLSRYAEKEKWKVRLKEAQAKVNSLSTQYEEQVKPILSSNHGENSIKLNKLLDSINTQVAAAYEDAQYWRKRENLISTAKRNASEYFDGSKKSVLEIQNQVTALVAKATKAEEDYPKKQAEIRKRLARFTKLRDESDKMLTAFSGEYQKHTEEDSAADYAVISDSFTGIRDNLEIVTKDGSGKLSKAYDSLYKEYTKILVDQKGEFEIELGRTSWDESSDSFTEQEVVLKPFKISLEDWLYLDNLQPAAVLGVISYGWGEWNHYPNIDKTIWDNLAKSTDLAGQWPSTYHDRAELEIDSIEAETYHKYKIIENGKESTTDWVEVDDEFFEDKLDDLGMELYTKPYGEFEDQASKFSNPPGIAFVGNKKYGEWKTAEEIKAEGGAPPSNGNNFWVFYGQYRFISDLIAPGHYYSRSEYDNWSNNYRGRRSYYGDSKDGKSHLYGTYGTRTGSNPRYKSTAFSNQGGYKQSVRTVRTTYRGGGPSGGGK